MELLKDCATKFLELLNYKYHIVIGRKGKSVEFDLVFEKTDFHHLAGLHKLIDNDFIRTSEREKIFDSIINGDVLEEKLSKSSFYIEVENRLPSLLRLEELLDNNDLIFHFSKKIDPTTKINANYILKCNMDTNVIFVFIIENNGNMKCVSQFPMGVKDYTLRQMKYTLLLKEKVDVRTNTIVSSYINPNYVR